MRKKSFNQLPEAIEILGENFELTDNHNNKLQELENFFGKLLRGPNAKIVAYFIKYDLDDWIYRLRELKKLKSTVSEKRYILMMGDIEGKNIGTKSQKRKKHPKLKNIILKNSVKKKVNKFGKI